MTCPTTGKPCPDPEQCSPFCQESIKEASRGLAADIDAKVMARVYSDGPDPGYRELYENLMAVRMTGPEQRAEQAASALLGLQRAVREAQVEINSLHVAFCEAIIMVPSNSDEDDAIITAVEQQGHEAFEAVIALLPDPAGTTPLDTFDSALGEAQTERHGKENGQRNGPPGREASRVRPSKG